MIRYKSTGIKKVVPFETETKEAKRNTIDRQSCKKRGGGGGGGEDDKKHESTTAPKRQTAKQVHAQVQERHSHHTHNKGARDEIIHKRKVNKVTRKWWVGVIRCKQNGDKGRKVQRRYILLYRTY